MTDTQTDAGGGGFVVIASCHLNFYPGTMNPTPPEYRRETRSKRLPTLAHAQSMLMAWRDSVESPGWEFRIETARP